MSNKITPITYAIHADGESPIFGQTTIHVTAEDEGAGLLIHIKADLVGALGYNRGEIKLDPSELADVVAVAEMLRLAHGGKA